MPIGLDFTVAAHPARSCKEISPTRDHCQRLRLTPGGNTTAPRGRENANRDRFEHPNEGGPHEKNHRI